MLKKIIIREKNRNDIHRVTHLRKKNIWRANRCENSLIPEVSLLDWIHRLERIIEDPVVIHA